MWSLRAPSILPNNKSYYGWISWHARWHAHHRTEQRIAPKSSESYTVVIIIQWKIKCIFKSLDNIKKGMRIPIRPKFDFLSTNSIMESKNSQKDRVTTLLARRRSTFRAFLTIAIPCGIERQRDRLVALMLSRFSYEGGRRERKHRTNVVGRYSRSELTVGR